MPLKANPKVMDDDYNLEPGNNDAQKRADSVTWKVDADSFLGGKMKPLGAGSGPMVGSPFDGDVMGEERSRITFPSGGKK
jgi:hypothetical protein